MCKHKNGLFLFYANSLPGRRFVMSGSVSPLPWTGNKGCIYTTIDAFMPPHRTYDDLYASTGAGSDRACPGVRTHGYS